ncbi:MAG: aldehyde dehydrogenase family protein, partial [Nitrospinota bacterium]
IAPALAAGNTVVLKPAEHTPVTALELGRLVERAGFPPGVVNIVPGFGETAGDALVRHPDVDKIAFTGETVTGQTIARNAADTLKHVSFELGGKSPNIVFDDYDLDDAVTAAMAGVFVASGQTCVAGSRLFLHERIHDAFLERLVERAGRVRVGDPLRRETQMGSQACEQQWNKIRELVRSGVEQGAEVLTGGRPPEDPALASGFFFTPTVFSNVETDMRIAQEEIFGPVVSAFKFSDEDELVERANAVKYGLAGGVWTRDIKRALRVARRIRAGTIWINCYRKVHWAVPFGGYKMSGYGRENGQEVLDLYTQTKTVWVDLTEAQPNPYAD